MTKELHIGADSFWEMVALTMAGRLASCMSCVEHFYFQSSTNSWLFLEACASSGLLQKVSLLDLFGDVGSHTDAVRHRYDEPIYLSAPEFRRAHRDEARRRLDTTKNAVFSALRLFYEELRADRAAVEAAYDDAIATRALRRADLAEKRRDVELSSLAKLRLIQDGFRFRLRQEYKKEGKELDNRAEEREVAALTSKHIRQFIGASRAERSANRLGEELETFVFDFLNAPAKIEAFWDTKFGHVPPRDYWVQWLPVVLNLAWGRFRVLTDEGRGPDAESFASKFSDVATAAARRQKPDTTELRSLQSLLDDWDMMTSGNELLTSAVLPAPVFNASLTLH